MTALDESFQMDEKSLLLRISAGDTQCFADLVGRYWKKVFGQSMAYAKSVTVAEELTQDVFMDVWNSREKLPAIEHFSNFLFIVTRNRVLKLLRQKLAVTLSTEDLPLQEDLWLPASQTELRELRRLINDGIQGLPPVRKKVFEMSRMEGMSYDQIGNALNISRNTVKEHIVKALSFLRQYLSEHGVVLELIVFMLLPFIPALFF